MRLHNIPLLVGGGFLLAAVAAAGVALWSPKWAGLWLCVSVVAAGTATVGAVWFVLARFWRRPVQQFIQVLERSSTGDSLYRCQPHQGDLGELGAGINRALEKLTDLSVNVIDADRELQWAQQELALKEKLDEKSHLLSEANQQLEERVRELSLLFEISRALTLHIDLTLLLKDFCQVGLRTFQSDRLAVLVYDEEEQLLEVKASWGFGDRESSIQGMKVHSGEGVAGTVFETRSLKVISDLQKETRFLHFRGKVRLSGSMVVLPLMAGDRCIGVVLLQRDKPAAFSMEEIGLFHIVAHQLSAAVENAMLHEKTVQLATHDRLTGLANRRALEARLDMDWERSRRFGTTLSFMMVDVDHFKKFNDQYGHLVGDMVLSSVGKLIPTVVRKVDLAARFGGEEFCVVLPRTTLEEAQAVAEKLRASVQELCIRVPACNAMPGITVSVGVASTDNGPQSAVELVDMADHALILAKESGRNRVMLYGTAEGPQTQPEFTEL
jgi:diguanylate cyclase (GGDEF)-like protein